MNIPHFFIDRPRFAVVISIVIVLLGAIAFPNLPVAQFPEVAPPTVVVRANYPGATPDVVAETVAAPAGTGNQRSRADAVFVLAGDFRWRLGNHRNL